MKKKDIANLKKKQILQYHWSDTKKVYQDFIYLNNFAEKILVSLSKKLNHIHQTNYSKEYWKIIIGNWLFTFIHILYDRWESVRKAFDDFDINETKIIQIKKKDVVPQSIENFIDNHQDKWIITFFQKF